MYGDDKGPKVWAAINTCLRDLFEEYRVMYAPENASPQTTREAESASGSHKHDDVFDCQKMRLNSGGSSSNKSELDKFLAACPVSNPRTRCPCPTRYYFSSGIGQTSSAPVLRRVSAISTRTNQHVELFRPKSLF